MGWKGICQSSRDELCISRVLKKASSSPTKAKFVVMSAKADIQVLNGIARLARDLKKLIAGCSRCPVLHMDVRMSRAHGCAGATTLGDF